MRHIAAFLLVVILSFPAFANETTIRLGLITWPGHGAVFVGKEKGFFSGLDIKTSILDDTATRNAAWLSGKLDMVVNTVDVTPVEYTQGFTGKLFAVTDASVGGDGIITKKDIASIKDLKGKKISVARGNPSHFFLYKVLRDNKMSLADVKLVYFDDASLAAQAFISGNVDAAVTYEPYMTKAVKSMAKSKILLTSREYPEDIIDVMRVSDSFLQANPQAMKAFVTGLFESIEYIEKNPEESAKIIGKGFNVPAKDIKEMMQGVAFFDTKKNNAYICSKKPKLVKLYNEATELWLKEKIITKNPPIGRDVLTDIGCSIYGRN